MSHYQTTLSRILAVGLITCGTAGLYAQETAQEPLVELAPFTVTAEGAQSILQISQRDLEQRQANDLEDALSLDASITVGGSTGVAQKIYVRNLGEDMINISVDGATQSGSLFHHTGRIAVEPDLLKRIEVQPGVGNAPDGPGALGGAIRFITKDPGDLLEPGQQFGSLLKYGYFSNTRGYKGSVSGFGRLNDNWSSLVSIVYSEHEEIEDGDGNRLTGSDTRQQVVLGKVTGEFNKGQSLRVSFEQLDEEGTKLRRPEWGPGPSNPQYYMETNRRTATLNYGLRPEVEGPLDLNATLSYSQAGLMQIGPWGPYEGAVETVQFDLRNTQRIHRQELVYGLDHRTDEVSAGPDTNPDSVGEKGSVTGVFVQDKIALSDQISLSLGARYDSYELTDLAGRNFDQSGFSPNAGLTWQATKEFSMMASAATAYRGTQIADAFRVDIHQNDPDLKAESSRNYELRLLYQNNGVSLEAGAYNNLIEDVVSNDVPWGRLYTNVGDLETQGFFARVSHSTQTTNLTLQYNNADTTLDDRVAIRYQYGSVVSSIGDTWVADASWHPFDSIDLGWNTRLVQGIDSILIPDNISGIPNGTISKPGYVTHDFYVRWSPRNFDALTLSLTVKNAFDKLYRSHGSLEDLTAFPGFGGVVGAYEAGRDIRVSASFKF